MSETLEEKPQEQPRNAEPRGAAKPPLKAGGDLAAIIPQDLDEAWRLSCTFVKAGMVPKSYEGKTYEETVSKVMIGIMKSMEVGLKPITGLSSIMIVNNRPCLWGDGAIALVQNSGKLEWMKEWFEGTAGKPDWTAHCMMKRVGNEVAFHRTFSHAEADRAKLLGKVGPWMSYPQRMLQMRARSWTIRDGFSDVLCGLGIVEEVQDYPTDEKKPVDASFLDDDPVILPVGPQLIDGAPDHFERTAQEVSPCDVCGGTGSATWKDETGEGIGPCPVCKPSKAG